MAGGGNIGVRLRPDMLVIDVNLRETGSGKSPIQWLENSLGISLSRAPLVLTGGGGQHFYFSKPAKSKICSRLFGIPGLRFRSAIGQVLASGSIYPTTREYYRCEILQDVFAVAPEIPIEVLHRMAKQGGGFQVTCGPALHPSGAVDSDPSVLLMCIKEYHRTTGAAGRERFVEWAISHPDYADCRERIEALWNSFNTDTIDNYYRSSRTAGRYSHPGGIVRAERDNSFTIESKTCQTHHQFRPRRSPYSRR